MPTSPPRGPEIDGAPWRGALLDWFRAHRRDLPWRRSRDPYRVWISEAMLQQTRVETVIPYFERFLARFPTVEALALGPVEDVLAAWSGLGYYRRARSLHAAASLVLARHAGLFPSTRLELLELPGIGPYTAGAIASIAFDRPEALVDGNVARVLARWFALDRPLDDPAMHKQLWEHARALVPERGAGEWNQALMELGAIVCTPRDPNCAECPVRDACAALAQGRVDELPRPKRRPTPIDVALDVAVVIESGRWLVEQRSDAGRMAGLWQLPTIEPSGENRLHPGTWPRAQDDGALFAVDEAIGDVRHSITRHRVRARALRARWLGGEPREPLRWARTNELDVLGLTGLTRKIVRLPGLAR